MNEDDEADYRREAYFEREARRARACQCYGDMPGHCPGPAACPMCQGDDAEDE